MLILVVATLLTVAMIVLIVIVVRRTSKRDTARLEALFTYADAKQFRFEAGGGKALAAAFPSLAFLRRRRAPYYQRVFTGTHAGHEAWLFEMQLMACAPENASEKTHICLAIQHCGRPVGPLSVRTESRRDKVGAVFGRRDIELESAAFNRRFFVSADDAKWATDVLRPHTMEVLLAEPPYLLSLRDEVAVVTFRGPLTPASADKLLTLTQVVVEGLPS